jgi:hypothetical protein
MHITRTLTLTLLVLLIALAGVPAGASGAVTVGLGDHSSGAFGDPKFGALGLKRARKIVPWNVALRPGDRAVFDAWLDVASATGIEPFVTFGAASGSLCPGRPCSLPSIEMWRKAMRVFRRRWPEVRTLGVWNEANHRTQPTFKNPQRAAQYYLALRKECRSCQIVAADVIDDRNMVRWLRDFRSVAPGARLWGLHNYRDTNPRRGQRYGGTKTLLQTVPGKVWLTETGGIVKFVLPDGRTLFPYSERRANVAISRLFRLAKQYRSRIARLYVYNWRQDSFDNRFDAGLLKANGTPRPSYHTLKRWLGTPWFGV